MDNTIYYIRVSEDVCVAFSKTCATMFLKSGGKSKKEIELIALGRFRSQMIHDGLNFSSRGIKNVWLNFDEVLKKNTNEKPKLYEIKEKDGGVMVIKHEKPLYDEDEVKLMLFKDVVNK